MDTDALRLYTFYLFRDDRFFKQRGIHKGIAQDFLVPEARVELARAQGPLDFESSASTSSTTPAPGL